jgi:ribose transport system substrate-binding protein
MRFRESLSGFLCASLLAACGGMESRPAVDAAPPPDTAPAVSPFVPQAIETVINSMVAAVTALGLPGSAKPPIAVQLKDLAGYFAPLVTGANRMGMTLACPLVVQSPFVAGATDIPSEQAAIWQNQVIQSYLDGGVYRGMALSPQQTDADSVAYLNKFVEQRGPVVTIDSDSPTSQRSYFIATANYQAGYTAGAMLAKVLNPGDAIVVFGTTVTAWTSGMERAQGAEDGATAGGLTLTPRISPIWTDATDLAALQAALADPQLNIKGMLCIYSDAYLCAQAAEAVAGAPGIIKIVGFDMTATTKTYFDKGYFTGIAVQRQYYMGELGVLVPYCIDVLGAAATNQLLQPLLLNGTFIDTGIDIITTDNYADYMTFLSTLGINA